MATTADLLRIETSEDYHIVSAGPIFHPDHSTSHLSVNAAAGGEIQIDVLLYDSLRGKVSSFTTLYTSHAPQ